MTVRLSLELRESQVDPSAIPILPQRRTSFPSLYFFKLEDPPNSS